LRATASTGRRKGLASFNFFNERIVDWQKRYCAVLKVDGGVGVGGVGVPLEKVEVEAGGGVAECAKEDLSASECILGLLAGGGLSSSSSMGVVYDVEGSLDPMVAMEEEAGMLGVVTGDSVCGSLITTSPFGNRDTGSSVMLTSSRCVGESWVALGRWVGTEAEG
jgi:hypothetical protein